MDFDHVNLKSEDLNMNIERSIEDALNHLYQIIQKYMFDNPSLTVNSLSKRCEVSEPTLRRICKNELKRLPTTTTILRLLSYISRKQKINEILDFFPGPLTEKLRPSMSLITDQAVKENQVDLSKQLKDPIRYLIYKLASNDKGVTQNKIQELFGSYGEEHLKNLKTEGLVYFQNDFYMAKYKSFCFSQDVFKPHFKATADFIKPHKLNNSPFQFSQLFFNCSDSVNLTAYSLILKTQRAAIKRISEILQDPKSKGEIPAFIIGAIDTLDNKSAFELSKS